MNKYRRAVDVLKLLNLFLAKKRKLSMDRGGKHKFIATVARVREDSLRSSSTFQQCFFFMRTTE